MLKYKGLLTSIFIPILSWFVLPSLSFGETKVGGPIFQDTRWTLAGSPYIVVMNAGVEKDITLTIEPGVNVKFDGNFFLEVSGTLIAGGTSANPIIFTSNKPEKNPGDWQGIKFLEDSVAADLDDEENYLSGSILEHCKIEYGRDVISYDGVPGFINSCTIASNSGTAISASYSPLLMVLPPVNMTMISNNTIKNNREAINISYSRSPISIIDCTISDNSGGIIIGIYSSRASVTIEDSTISRNSGAAIVSISGDPFIYGLYETPIVNVNSSEIMGNSPSGKTGYVVYLASCYANLAESRIKGNVTTGGEACVYINRCHSADIRYNVISQNPGYKYGAIYTSSSTNIDHNLITENTGGIRINHGTISATHNTITNNSGSGLHIESGVVSIGKCNVHDNTVYDVYNGCDWDVQAASNWWGTTDPLAISAHIYDHFDEPKYGKVVFHPYSTAPVLDTGPTEEEPPFPLRLITDSPSRPAGVPFIVSVQMGDEEHPVSDLLSISFKLNYTNTEVINVRAVEKGDFLGDDSTFSFDLDDVMGRVSINASRKTDTGGVSGYGIVSEVELASTPDLAEDEVIELALSDAAAQDADGNPIQIVAEKAQITITKAEIPSVSVWPGDTDNNGVVDGRDVLPIGMYWKQAGPARSPALTAWEAQQATPWTPQEATYADADGNGVVDGRDVLPIGKNWKKTHPSNSQAAPCFASVYDAPIDHAKYLSAYQVMLEILEESPIGKDAIGLRRMLRELIALAAKPMPLGDHLGRNFPNPFNPETWIPYSLAQEADVLIDIYDVSGRLVRTLSLGKKKQGAYVTKDVAAYWDGKNSQGEEMSSGVFFYRIEAGSFSATRKMIMVK